MDDCDGVPVDVDHTVDGQELLVHYPSGHLYPTGVPVTVTYAHAAPVPQDVVDEVAAIVARHLTVDPESAQVTQESAGPYSTRYADWVSDTSLFTEEECDIARSYRYPASSVIIQSP